MTARSLLLVLALLPACGLIPPDPIGFRSYELRDIGYAEGQALVLDTTRTVLTDLFGGVGMAWDAETRNIKIDPVFDEQRRMRLYLHLEPAPGGLDVEMFALVEHLEATSDPTELWGRPMQDVPFEEMLHRAFIDAIRARRPAPVSP